MLWSLPVGLQQGGGLARGHPAQVAAKRLRPGEDAITGVDLGQTYDCARGQCNNE